MAQASLSTVTRSHLLPGTRPRLGGRGDTPSEAREGCLFEAAGISRLRYLMPATVSLPEEPACQDSSARYRVLPGKGRNTNGHCK